MIFEKRYNDTVNEDVNGSSHTDEQRNAFNNLQESDNTYTFMTFEREIMLVVNENGTLKKITKNGEIEGCLQTFHPIVKTSLCHNSDNQTDLSQQEKLSDIVFWASIMLLPIISIGFFCL